MSWHLFDNPTVEEMENDQAVAEIEALEKSAPALIRQISAFGEKHRGSRSAAQASLIHIATLTTYEVKTVGKGY